MNVAEVIGLLVSSFPGVEYGPLHYRALENDKTIALRDHNGSFAASIILSEESISDVNWWVNNVETAFKLISHSEPDVIIQTDASTQGWGAVRQKSKTGGRWNSNEAHNHINFLELLAILFALKTLCVDCQYKHIQIQCDNTTAVCYIQNMGGTKSMHCNTITKQIWDYCIQRNMWLRASHLPGSRNYEADLESRHFNDRTEWMLDRNIYEQITHKFGHPTIDLFATRSKTQCPVYASWRPDPDAQIVDAFSTNWNTFFFYAFPPFSLIYLKKIRDNKAEGILIVPLWTTQNWYPRLLRLLVNFPVLLPPRERLLTQPNTNHLHPLGRKLS